MIRTNLIKRESAGSFQADKWLARGLFVVLLVQSFFLYVNYTGARSREELFNTAKQELEQLKSEVEKFQSGENLQELAGKVAARNNWLTDRKNSPLTNLARLQKDCPGNISFLSYQADLVSGKIMLTAPDLNSVSGWLNSHFSNRGNISVVGRENNLLLIQFIWSG